MIIIYLIRNQYAKSQRLLRARGFWKSDDIDIDFSGDEDTTKGERVSEDSSNDLPLIDWSSKEISFRVDHDVCQSDDSIHVDKLSTESFNRLPQECKQSEEDSLGNLLSGECEVDFPVNEDVIDLRKRSEKLINHLSQLYEQPVRDIYLYPSADDSSVSTLGSLCSPPLPKVVHRKIPILKGTWNDGNIVEVLCDSNYISRISHKIPTIKGTWNDGNIVEVSCDTE